MMNPYELSLALYNLALLPVLFLSVLFLIFALMNLFVDGRREEESAKPKRYPFVTVQIPSYNDPVAARCINACLAFDYPKDRYEIMIVDDSTNESTRRLLRGLAAKHRGVIKYVHRESRDGYKPGALRDAMHLVKGEIIVIFDADFIPKRKFLSRIVVPFEDPKVAVVQARQAIRNYDVNIISRFAAYLLMVHHTILMPVNDKINSVFFCGTAGAIRKKALLEVGGWNAKSITEDSDLSVKLLSKGYRNTYIKFETPSEVPVTIEAFIKQQMRWSYGNIRVFVDHAKLILFKRGLKIPQRLMISFATLGTLVAPAVIIMTLAGFAGWFFGDLKLFLLNDLFEFFIKFFYTAGFLVTGIVAFHKQKMMKEFPHLLLATFSVSIILALANTVAGYKALFMKDKPLFESKNSSWVCTPKEGNMKYAKDSA